MIQGKAENGKLIISLDGKIDASNAPAVEERIRTLCEENPFNALELDCDRLSYASSAGLRVFLRLSQEVDDTKLVNVHPELYSILEMTGFTEIIRVQRAYRVLSVENCEVIGEGSNGRVYRIDAETIVKVYLSPDALPQIHRERELARLAFVSGVPTAIPYDVVKIQGGGYGSVFELLDAKSFAALLRRGEKTPEEIAGMSVRLLQLIHSREVQSDILPDMKAVALDWAAFLQSHLPKETAEKLCALISAVPAANNLLHGDYHIKNIMLQDSESLLIDMDTLCHGHPIFELGSMYNAYAGFGLVRPERVEEFMGLPYDTCRQLWRRSLALYLGSQDEKIINETEEKARIIGLTRLMRREILRDGMNREEGRQMIKACRAALEDMVSHVDTLVF